MAANTSSMEKDVIYASQLHLFPATTSTRTASSMEKKVIYGNGYCGGSSPLACRIGAMAGRRSQAMKAAAAAGDCALVLTAPE
jgi:hypothetical protein